MPTDEKKGKTPSKAQEVGRGYQALKGLVEKSAQETKKSPYAPPEPPKAPPIDTDSFGGLLKSLKNRASYAIWGPETPADKKKDK